MFIPKFNLCLKGLHYTSDYKNIQLQSVIDNVIFPVKGINPSWFVCLPWRVVKENRQKNGKFAKENHPFSFEKLMKTSKENFFGTL